MTVEVDSLVRRLMWYNYAYRIGEPVVFDYEYDREIELLKFLDSSINLLKMSSLKSFMIGGK